jgi:hypothetical protein
LLRMKTGCTRIPTQTQANGIDRSCRNGCGLRSDREGSGLERP